MSKVEKQWEILELRQQLITTCSYSKTNTEAEVKHGYTTEGRVEAPWPLTFQRSRISPLKNPEYHQNVQICSSAHYQHS